MSPGDGGDGGGGDGGGFSGSDPSAGGTFGGPDATTNAASASAQSSAAGPAGPASGPGPDSLGPSPVMGFDPTFGPQAPVAVEGFDPSFGPQLGNPLSNALMGSFISAILSGIPFAGIASKAVSGARDLGLAQTGRADPATGEFGSPGFSAAGTGVGSTGGDAAATVPTATPGVNVATPTAAPLTPLTNVSPTPSVSALAQALRTVPDLGYSPGGTVFGSESTDTPKPIWNKASLRVTDQGTA